MSYVTILYRMDTSLAIWITQKSSLEGKKNIKQEKNPKTIALLQITMFVPKFTESKASP